MQGTYQVCTAKNAKETNNMQVYLLLSCKQQIFDDSIETVIF